jgi:hypothetical protein
VNVFQFPVHGAPQHVLGAVAADAEVGGLTVGITLLPDRLAAAAPPRGDGVTHEQDVDVALLGALDVSGVLAEEVGIDLPVAGILGRRDIGRLARQCGARGGRGGGLCHRGRDNE